MARSSSDMKADTEMRKKALLSPRIGKHGKWKKTIEREKRRALFDEIISQDFPSIVKAARPEYQLDQFIGKSPDIFEHRIKVEKDPEKEKRAKAFDEWYKKHGN
jgi:hypothetical protein